MKKRIFILDDEPDMLKLSADLLVADGFIVSTDTSPISALKKIFDNPPNLILLDNRMPEMDGFQVCRELKNDARTKNVPIIMVSVRSEETDVVVGLQLGADDYVSKPLRRHELLARVKNVLRRVQPDDQHQHIEVGPLKLDYGTFNAWCGNDSIDLTPKEFQLLGLFLKRQGRVLTRSSISEIVWGTEFTGSTRTIDVHVDQLRKKLGKYSTCIKSLKGIGYRFEVEEE